MIIVIFSHYFHTTTVIILDFDICYLKACLGSLYPQLIIRTMFGVLKGERGNTYDDTYTRAHALAFLHIVTIHEYEGFSAGCGDGRSYVFYIHTHNMSH